MNIPALRTICKALIQKADWEESKHPGADNGQFGSGAGGGTKKPSKMPIARHPVSATRVVAEKFAAKGKYTSDVYHVTTKQNAEKIRDIGFKLTGGESFGGEWGAGVYVATDKESTEYYQSTTNMTSPAETLNLKIKITNPIKFDASNVESPVEGAEEIAAQIGQSESYDQVLHGIKQQNEKIEMQAKEKFGRPLRATDISRDESSEDFENRFDNQRKQYRDYYHDEGYVDSPSGVAISRVATNAGYDSIIIHDSEFRPQLGGNQVVVFNPQNIMVIDENIKKRIQQSALDKIPWLKLS